MSPRHSHTHTQACTSSNSPTYTFNPNSYCNYYWDSLLNTVFVWRSSYMYIAEGLVGFVGFGTVLWPTAEDWHSPTRLSLPSGPWVPLCTEVRDTWLAVFITGHSLPTNKKKSPYTALHAKLRGHVFPQNEPQCERERQSYLLDLNGSQNSHHPKMEGDRTEE